MIKALILPWLLPAVHLYLIISDPLVQVHSTSSYLYVLSKSQLQSFSWASIVLSDTSVPLNPNFQYTFEPAFNPLSLDQTTAAGTKDNGIQIYQTSPFPINSRVSLELTDIPIIRLQIPFLFTLNPASHQLLILDIQHIGRNATYPTQATQLYVSALDYQSLVLLSSPQNSTLFLFSHTSTQLVKSLDMTHYLSNADKYLLHEDVLAVIEVDQLQIYLIKVHDQSLSLQRLWRGSLPMEILHLQSALLPLYLQRPSRNQVECIVGHSPSFLVSIEPPHFQQQLVHHIDSSQVYFLAFYGSKIFEFKVEDRSQSVTLPPLQGDGEGGGHDDDDDAPSKKTNYIQMLCLAIGISIALLLVSGLVAYKVEERNQAQIYKKRRRERIYKQRSDLSRMNEMEERIVSERGIREGACAICWEELKKNGILTRCKHAFHKKCLYQWLINHSSCPLCRKEFSQFK